MSAYLVINGYTYNDIKSLSFVPEYDPTLNTLPICEFSAEIKTTSPAGNFKGLEAALYEKRFASNPSLLAGAYKVSDAVQVGHNIVRVTAQSLLAYLDKRVMPPFLYSGMTPENFFIDLLTGATVEEQEETMIWDSTNPQIRLLNYVGLTVGGLFPQQTARERLQMFCQAESLRVLQWGSNSQYGISLMYTNATEYSGGTMIQPEDTFARPVTSKISDVGELRIEEYYDHTTTYHEQTADNGWKKYVFQEGWADPDTGLTQDEIAVYYTYQTRTYDFGTAGQYKGIAEIKNNLSMGHSDNLNGLRTAYFSHYEVELDALCDFYPSGQNLVDRQFFPGDIVSFYLDADSGSVYSGLVKSANYMFGKCSARATLKILTNLQPIQTGTLTVNYIYYYSAGVTHTVLTKVYRVPAYGMVLIPIPAQITAWDGDELVYLTSIHSTGYTYYQGPDAGDTDELDILYNRSNP